jgi:O-acetyl-ADP-ribose deacetylase (regulator of RNase III)
MSDLPSKILLVDRSATMCGAWRECFDEYEEVEVIEGDYFLRPADAMVSPANSFAIMDGGLDLAIRHELGFEVERSAQRVVVERHHGELPVGHAEIVATSRASWPFLVIAPTMRIPESVARTLNAYLAFRAVLLAVSRHNQDRARPRIDSVVCSGLGTGVGGMEPRRCALQMRMAYRQVRAPARIPSFELIHEIHGVLQRS